MSIMPGVQAGLRGPRLPSRPAPLPRAAAHRQRWQHTNPKFGTVAAAAASPAAAFLADSQDNGLQKLRLLTPHLFASIPTQPLQQQQQHGVKRKHLQQQEQQQHQQQRLGELLIDTSSGCFETTLHKQHTTPAGGREFSLTVGSDASSTAADERPISSSSSKRARKRLKKVMSRIRSAGSLADLQAVYQQHEAILDPLAVAALLNRLAHVWSATVKQEQQTRKQQQQQQKQRFKQQQQVQTAPKRLGLQVQQEQHQQEQADTSAVPFASLEAAPASAAAAAGDVAGYTVAVQLLQSLLTKFVSHVSCYSSRQLSSTLWVVGRFHRAAASHSDIQAAAAAILDALLAPHTALNTAEADELLADTRHEAQQHQQHQQHQQQQQQAAGSQVLAAPRIGSTCLLATCGNAADIQNTMWALGRLAQVLDINTLLPQHGVQQGPRTNSTSSDGSSDGSSSGSAVLHLLDQLCGDQLVAKQGGGQFVANCLYGFAHMQHPAHQLFAALLQRANPNYIKTLQSQHVVSITWAAAKLGHHNTRLYHWLLWRAVVVRRELYSEGVAVLLAALARAQHKPDPRAVAQLLQVCKAQWWKLRGKHLSNLVWGLMGTGCLANHTAFFTGVLLCQATVKLHELQPVAVATLLQALLQVSQSPAGPQHGIARLNTHAGGQAGGASLSIINSSSSSGTGTGSSGRTHHTSSSSSSGLGPIARHPVGTVQQRLLQGVGQLQGSSSSSSDTINPMVMGVSPAAAARAQLGLSAALSGLQGDAHTQLTLLFRQMGAHIQQQLPDTTPQTLYNIIVCLAGMGYYEPRLYSNLAGTAAAAAAGKHTCMFGDTVTKSVQRNPSTQHPSVLQQEQQWQQQQQQQGEVCVYSAQQCLQLLRAFGSMQHAAPELWQQLLPVVAADVTSLTDLQLIQLLTAATAAGGGGGLLKLGPQALQLLLQVAAHALQRQELQFAFVSTAKQVQRLVTLATASGALMAAASTQQQQQEQERGQQQEQAADVSVLRAMQVQTDMLVGQMTAAVCTQPQLLPWATLLQLLQAALSLQHTAAPTSSCSSTAGSSHGPGWRPAVGSKVLQHLALLVQSHPKHLAPGAAPADLVLLLQCVTHPAMWRLDIYSSSSSRDDPHHLADAYAEALLHCMTRCSVYTLVALLQVLAAAWQQQGQCRYGNVGLVRAAARQLHSKVHLATKDQLAAALAALEQLQQQGLPLYRLASRVLAPTEPVAHQ